jgi:antitoxin (DNA-binding transcriptional repressor) of toxin-antitoxin stability system
VPKKTLQQVAEDEVIHKLASFIEVIEVKTGHQTAYELPKDWIGGVGLKEVWGVKEAKTRLPNLLREASAGEVHFVTAGDGSAIVMVSAKNLADAMSSIEERKGLTLADAIGQLPYPPSELKPVRLRHRPPSRGLLRRARVAADA